MKIDHKLCTMLYEDFIKHFGGKNIQEPLIYLDAIFVTILMANGETPVDRAKVLVEVSHDIKLKMLKDIYKETVSVQV